MNRITRRIPRVLRIATVVALVLIVAGANVLAYVQARALTHYSSKGHETKAPDELSWKDMARLLFTGPNIPRPAIEHKPSFLTWYTVHTYPSSGGETLEAWHIGRSNATAIVVMFPGYGSSKSSLLDEAAAFRSLGYETLLVDFRGSGGSTGSITTLGYREADDVAASVEYAESLSPGKAIFIYGSSMGSVAALRAMAVKGVRPAGAILECPFDSMYSTIGNRLAMMNVPSFPAAQLLTFWGGVQLGFNAFALDSRDYAARVTVPVLLIGGDEDRRVSVDQLRSVYNRLAGPKRIEVFKEVGHGGYLKHDARRWRRAVGEFMASPSRMPAQ